MGVARALQGEALEALVALLQGNAGQVSAPERAAALALLLSTAQVGRVYWGTWDGWQDVRHNNTVAACRLHSVLLFVSLGIYREHCQPCNQPSGLNNRA